MNQYDQPHAVSETTPSLSIFKNSPLRLEIPSRAMSIMNPSPASDYFSPTSADGNESNIDHITCLERSLCSNFFCCGNQLPDLHALLDHFEEDHIMVLAPNGKRVYPCDGLRSVPLQVVQSTLTTLSPSSSRSSSVAPSSSSSTPSTPSDFSSPISGPFASRKSSLTAVTPVYTPFTPSLPVDPADPYPDTNEIIMEQDMRIYGLSEENYPTVLPVPLESLSPPASSDEDEEMSDGSALDAPASLLPPYVYTTGRIKPIAALPKHVKFASITTRGRPPSKSLESPSATPPSILSSKSKSKVRHSLTGLTLSSRRREKLFLCPTPRCTKSYLNPNGLKYHMEKGTCQIKDESESEAGDSPALQSPESSVLMPYGTGGTPTSSSSSNTHPHIKPHPGPIQDVEMQKDTTTSGVPGTHYLNSTSPTPVPTAGSPKIDDNVDNDTDSDVVIDEVTETTAASGSSPASSSVTNLKSHLEAPEMQQEEQEKEQTQPIPGSYYRHRPSSDICPASTAPPSISTPSAASPNNVKGDDNSNHRTQDIEPQSRVATPASAAAAIAPKHVQVPQQIYHYPVPSYPQLGGPNALLAGYTTFIHRPYFAAAADRTPSMRSATPADYAQIYSPIPVMSALNSSRLQ